MEVEVRNEMEAVNWKLYQTAYDNTAEKIPIYLQNLFSADMNTAMNATHQLWCSLCHQHAYISSASLPAYNILKKGLLILNDKLKIELLDIFLGFAVCTDDSNTNSCPWSSEIRKKLKEDINIFHNLIKSLNTEISDFANAIVENLTNK